MEISWLKEENAHFALQKYKTIRLMAIISNHHFYFFHFIEMSMCNTTNCIPTIFIFVYYFHFLFHTEKPYCIHSHLWLFFFFFFNTGYCNCFKWMINTSGNLKWGKKTGFNLRTDTNTNVKKKKNTEKREKRSHSIRWLPV